MYVNRTRIAVDSLHPINDSDEIGIGLSSDPALLQQVEHKEYFIFIVRKLQNVVVIDDSDDEIENTHNVVVKTEADSSNIVEAEMLPSNASLPNEENQSSNESVKNEAKIPRKSIKNEEIPRETMAVQVQSVKNEGIVNIIKETMADVTSDAIVKIPSQTMAVQEQSVTSETNAPEPKDNVETSPDSNYEKQDSCIIIDDDDDDFPCSQLFSVGNVKEEKEEKSLSDSMFFNIKKELEEMDQLEGERAPVEVDSDSDFDILDQLQDAVNEIDVSIVISKLQVAVQAKLGPKVNAFALGMFVECMEKTKDTYIVICAK